MGSKLVGRGAEVAALRRALDEVARGAGRTVLICGPAGIGKSRLAAELLTLAADRGFGTLEGRAHTLHTDLAYAPIVEALRPHLSDVDLLDGLAGLRPLLGDAQQQPGDPDLERTRMFDAAARLLHRIAERAPAVLFVDDLHWADRGTIELVHYLGRGAAGHKILVAAGYRSGEVAGALSELTVSVRRDDPDAELNLAPLSDSEVVELAGELLGGTPPERLLRGLRARAAGVPLFVRALVQAGDEPRTPVVVRDVVLGQLTRLDEGQRWLLELISVAGDGSEELLRAVWRTGDVSLTSALRGLIATGLVTEHEHGRTITYRVSHPLYAEVAYAELTVAERRRLHADLAAAMDRATPADVLGVAPHYLGAGDLVDSARAADVLAEAGRRAQHVGASDEAVRYLGAALAEARARGRDNLTAELLNRLGSARLNLGQVAEGAAAWQEALHAAERCHDVDRVIDLRFSLASLESELGNYDRADEHRQAGAALRPPSDPSAAAENAIFHLPWAAQLADEGRARAVAAELAAFRDADPGPTAQAAGHLGRALTAMLDKDFATALRESDSSMRAATRDDPAALLGVWSLRDLMDLSAVAGDLSAATDAAHRLLDLSAQGRAWPSVNIATRNGLALTHYLAGELDAALDQVDSAAATARRLGYSRSLARALYCQGFILAELGRLREARACLAEAKACRDPKNDAPLAIRAELAQTTLALRAGRPAEAPPPHTPVLTTEPFVLSLRLLLGGEAAHAAGDHHGAAAMAARLRALGRTAMLPDAFADRLDGLHAAALGNIDAAGESLRRAADRLAAIGVRVLGAQAQLEAAELTTDAARATVADCLTVFDRAGTAPWVQRARRLARTLGVRVSPGRRTGALSQREQQIVNLVADGLSNADIAARLFISERTVETHLRNSYARLGLHSRVALAQWASAAVPDPPGHSPG